MEAPAPLSPSIFVEEGRRRGMRKKGMNKKGGEERGGRIKPLFLHSRQHPLLIYIYILVVLCCHFLQMLWFEPNFYGHNYRISISSHCLVFVIPTFALKFMGWIDVLMKILSTSCTRLFVVTFLPFHLMDLVM